MIEDVYGVYKPLIIDEYNDKKSNDKHNCNAFFWLVNSIFPPDSRCGDTVDSRTAYCIIAAMLEWDLQQLLRRACCSRGWTGDLISRRTKKRSSLFERTWKRINMFSSFTSFLIHLDVEIVALHLLSYTNVSSTIPRFQFPIKSFTALTIPDVSREDAENLYPLAFVTCKKIWLWHSINHWSWKFGHFSIHILGLQGCLVSFCYETNPTFELKSNTDWHEEYLIMYFWLSFASTAILSFSLLSGNEHDVAGHLCIPCCCIMRWNP